MEVRTRDKKLAIKQQWKIFVVFCLCMFLSLSAYRGLRDIQSTLNLSQNVGFASLTVLYTSSLFAGLTAPAVVRCQLGTKWSLVLGFSLLAVYSASNYWGNAYLLLTVAVLPGVGAALIWTARGTYTTTIAMEIAHLKGRNSAVDIGLLNGIFHTVSFLSTTCGNLISSLVFGQPGDEDDGGDVNETTSQWNASTQNPETEDVPFCGMRACGGDIENYRGALRAPNLSTRILLISIYLGCGVLSVVLGVFFLDKVDVVKPGTRLSGKEDEATVADGEHSRSTWWELTAHVGATIRLMANPRMTLLIPTLLYVGMEPNFLGTHFTKFFVGCSQGIGAVGFVMMGASASSCVFSLLIGRLLKYVNRFALFIVGGAAYLLVLVCMLVWDPEQGRLWHLVMMTVAVGFARASLCTISGSLLGMLFVCQQEAAFGNFAVWQSLGGVATLALGIPQSICAYHVISIVMCILVLALFMYSLLELRLWRERLPRERGHKDDEGTEMTPELAGATATSTNNEISIAN